MHSHPKARNENLVVQTLRDETLVYDLLSHKAHCLNETSSFVWNKCNGINSPADIRDLLGKRAGKAVPDGLIELALAQLGERELLVDHAVFGDYSSSRREAIKRFGMASMLALPLITSIVTPAKGFVSATCTCTNNSQCRNYPSCPSTINCNALGLCAPNV